MQLAQDSAPSVAANRPAAQPGQTTDTPGLVSYVPGAQFRQPTSPGLACHWPPGQAVQLVAPCLFWNWPDGQGVQCEEPAASEKRPVMQMEHSSGEPAVCSARPTGHVTQLVMALAGWEVPGRHREQAAAAAAEKVPARQSKHSVEPAVPWYLPALQLTQTPVPRSAAKAPGGQLVHTVAPGAEKAPAAQDLHKAAVAVEKRPAAHALHSGWPEALWNLPAAQLLHVVSAVLPW